jgi:hypothetical protein
VRQGASICFLWQGERTAIETVSGCRPRLASAPVPLLAETGPVTRIAGLTMPSVSSVSVTVKRTTFSSPTTPLPAALNRRYRFFFLQFRPRLTAGALARVRWTLLAKNANRKTISALHT